METNESKAELSTLVVENVEVLVQTEQPDVNDCISDKNFNCEALHPTDPNQDKMRKRCLLVEGCYIGSYLLGFYSKIIK